MDQFNFVSLVFLFLSVTNFYVWFFEAKQNGAMYIEIKTCTRKHSLLGMFKII